MQLSLLPLCATMPSRAQRRGCGLLLASIVLVLCATHCYCDMISSSAGSGPAITKQDQLSGTARQGRSLLQNPDRPALNKYGGVNMSTMLASGYPLETHKVTTYDGWVLNLYRIPHGKNRNSGPGKRPVIYLHHGITLSSACFTLLNENESMAYILADAGFDVWMANTRGNTFSRGNFYHSYRDMEYWYHSIDQYATIDNPAMIDKALEVSGASKLVFVGHSQGSTIGYAMLAARPEYNDKISVMIHMGPVWFVQFLKAEFLKTFATVRNDDVLKLARSGEFLWQRTLAPYVPQCRTEFMAEGCVGFLQSMFFGPSSFVSVDDYPVIAQTWPASVASRNLGHYAQNLNRKNLEFEAWDYGTNCSIGAPFQESCNQMKYGSLKPYVYDLSKVTAPQVILEGEMDIMSTVDDVVEQRKRLVNADHFSIVYQAYSHMDYVWDRSARHMLDIVDIAFRYSPGTF